MMIIPLAIFCSMSAKEPVNADPVYRRVQEKGIEASGVTGSTVMFTVESAEDCERNAAFWINVPKDGYGMRERYGVYANGVYVGDIRSSEGDWHYEVLADGRKLPLRKGKNSVTVAGSGPFLPDVEHVRVFEESGRLTAVQDRYRIFRNGLTEGHGTGRNNSAVGTGGTVPDSVSIEFPYDPYPDVPDIYKNPPYDYDYALNIDCRYTHYNLMELTAGQNVSISCITEGSMGFVVEFFNTENPFGNAISVESGSDRTATLNTKIQEPGTYMLRVRGKENGCKGLCDLTVTADGSSRVYEKVPYTCMKLNCTKKEAEEYSNTFTANAEGDPMIFLHREVSGKETVAYYNDNSTTGKDFSWGLNSRIRGKFTDKIVSTSVSSARSSDPVTKCDLYMGCMDLFLEEKSGGGKDPTIESNVAETDTTIIDDPDKGKNFNDTLKDMFPNLKPEDAILSAPANDNYDCFLWAKGIYHKLFDPTSADSPYNYTGVSQTYGPGALECYDNFYGASLYPGSPVYTREGATEENSVIDLYADCNDEDAVYLHAAVRNRSGKNAHGYAWESKCGKGHRFFHPRHALEGGDYGMIAEYYRLLPDHVEIQPLLGAVADNRCVIEYVDFSEDELAYMKTGSGSVSEETMDRFNALYEECRRGLKKTDPVRARLRLRESDTYKRLAALCRETPGLVHTVYLKIGEQDELASDLLETLRLGDEGNQKKLVDIKAADRKVKKLDDGRWIYRTAQSTVMKFVKLLLAEEMNAGKRRRAAGTGGISYSNFMESFRVTPDGEMISVDFEMERGGTVSVTLSDMSGRVLWREGERKLEKGNHRYETVCPGKGVFIISVEIDGKLNVKKIMI